jgi:hypothetical protein
MGGDVVTDDKPPYEFGQTVYVVSADAHRETTVPCPICYGKRRVTVILGNDEQMSVECEYCGKGRGGPTGTAKEYGPSSRVTETTVTGMTRGSFGDGWQIETASYRSSRDPIFTSREEAEAKRVELHAEVVKRAADCNHASKYRGAREATWHLGYHRNGVRRARYDLAHHELKVAHLEAKVAAQKRPEPDPAP